MVSAPKFSHDDKAKPNKATPVELPKRKRKRPLRNVTVASTEFEAGTPVIIQAGRLKGSQVRVLTTLAGRVLITYGDAVYAYDPSDLSHA